MNHSKVVKLGDRLFKYPFSKVLLGLMAFWILITNMAAVPVGTELILDQNFNARSSRYYRGQQNIEGQLGIGTRVKVVQNQLMNSGNHGLFVDVLTGPFQGKRTWVYYDKANPRMKLDQGHSPQPKQSARVTASVTGYQSLDDLMKALPAGAAADLAPPSATSAMTRSAPAVAPVVAAAVDSDITEAVATCVTCDKKSDPLASVISQIGRGNPAVGARLAMAEIYQSCEVLSKPEYDVRGSQATQLSNMIHGEYYKRTLAAPVQNLVRVHSYLQDLKNNPNSSQCFPIRQKPPIFVYGGRPSYDANQNEINVFTKPPGNQSGVTGLDCSGFVSVSLSAAGLKLTPNIKNAGSNVTNTSALMGFNENNSCFQRPVVKKNQPFEVGDLLVFHGHVMIIDKIGADPLGFQKMKDQGLFPTDVNQCKYLQFQPENFNFSIIHSTGYKDIGVSRMKSHEFFSRPRVGKDGSHKYVQASYALRNIMIQACLSEFGVERKFDQDIYANLSGKGKLSSSQLLRHKGSSAPGCTFAEHERPKFKHQSCTGDCLTEALK